ncbi:MAG TPA: tyrosine--tRNA ligase, partial [Saprospiraceae bacterium]|nr:tyrosine--tRNA ligase [Saprospiraceae bacterium]
NCVLQMGGSDQWGNITSGTEFIRRNEPGSEVFALTSPLLTKADGKKFGKSEEGNIWLDPEMTTPYQFYQFWLNVDDRDLTKLFRYFSLLNRPEIELLEKENADNPNALKAILGKELTTRIHGDKAFESAKNVSEILFNPKASREQLIGLHQNDLKLISGEIPSFQLDRNILNEKTNIVDLLSEHTSVVSSKSDARRAIQSNSISINKDKISDIASVIQSNHLLFGRYMMIENGKKNKYMIEFI